MLNKYYQKGKKGCEKKDHERYQNLSEAEKEKSGNMNANDIKTFLKIKNKF